MSIFIKQKNLAEKLAIFSDTESGSHSALTAVLKEPFLYHGAALYNPLTDLVNHLINDIPDKNTDSWFNSTTEFGTVKQGELE